MVACYNGAEFDILTKKLHVVVRKRAWSLVVINGT
jgi:hypothetical protein